jgi:hypothetical protein
LVPQQRGVAGGAAGGAAGGGDVFNLLVEGALYVAHVAPWTSWKEVRKLERLAIALHACNARSALLHLSDESGLKDPSYQLWPLIIRNYFDARLTERWPKVMVAPLGYTSGFLNNIPSEGEGQQDAVSHHQHQHHRRRSRSEDGQHWDTSAAEETSASRACRSSDSSSDSSSSGEATSPPAALANNCRLNHSSSIVKLPIDREHAWAFVGNGLKQERAELIGAWAEAMPQFMAHGSLGFLDQGSTVVVSYKDILPKHRERGH